MSKSSKSPKAKNTKAAKAKKKPTQREVEITQEYRLMAFDYVMNKSSLDITDPANLNKVIKATEEITKYLQTGSYTAVTDTNSAPVV